MRKKSLSSSPPLLRPTTPRSVDLLIIPRSRDSVGGSHHVYIYVILDEESRASGGGFWDAAMVTAMMVRSGG